MAVFSSEDYQRLDYGLMQNGSVNLYFRLEVLAEDILGLKELDYQIDKFDCTTWESIDEMHNQISEKLNFPDYYGRNLDSLNDCLSDIEIREESGRVLVFHRFDDFTVKEPDVCWHLLDIISHNSWAHLLFGNRFFALAQSNNPEIHFDNLGSRSAMWNRKEWLNSSRGL